MHDKQHGTNQSKTEHKDAAASNNDNALDDGGAQVYRFGWKARDTDPFHFRMNLGHFTQLSWADTYMVTSSSIPTAFHLRIDLCLHYESL